MSTGMTGDKACSPLHRKRRLLWRRYLTESTGMKITIAVCVLFFLLLAVRQFNDGRRLPGFAMLILAGTTAATIPATRGKLRSIEQLAREDPPICVACEYDLAGIPIADDGCRVCPECGAAWR
ncbi:MAG: hypothetical protein IT435_12575 [Phycisphaerales bacterium]|nr:hypothetical protein [Phycisphaerales bacterium]